jgi:hypothetical protein
VTPRAHSAKAGELTDLDVRNMTLRALWRRKQRDGFVGRDYLSTLSRVREEVKHQTKLAIARVFLQCRIARRRHLVPAPRPRLRVVR